MGSTVVSDKRPSYNSTLCTNDRNDWIELLVGLAIFCVGVYVPPHVVGLFLEPNDLLHREPPMQVLQSGEIIVDLALNEPLVEPATVSCESLCCWRWWRSASSHLST